MGFNDFDVGRSSPGEDRAFFRQDKIFFEEEQQSTDAPPLI